MRRAAVVGCGDVSVVHLQAIAKLDEVELVGVCDTDQDRAAAAAERYGVPRFADHRQLLAAVRPDVVHVCTPHDQHTPVAVDCLDARVAVLVEKPVAHTVAEADRLIAAADRHPAVKIGICLQNRYNATTRAARDLLASGELGPVRGGSATVLWHRDPAYYQSRPWRGRKSRSGGGVLINQAIHTLDLMELLVGDVVRVRGHAGRHALDDIDVEDTASVLLDHTGGARSVVFATVGNVVDAPVTIEVVTERAVLLIRGDLTVSHADGRVETVAEPVASTGGRAYWGASHELLIADFYASLADPEPFWIGPREGARSLRLIHRLYQRNT
ncbi:gfo/Idh/MocA family oxidoreductase [Actinoplanes sp. ATCC 53533]|uniref:Gfo/Idh/MocA family protein n=1 Tax=Actinoplanes sp. ATCC 53533 TaxID=1288362 RepID=UPI000F777ED5|nr:Gfo/Idh/MocA family oxidoreductase [Actinoplanes sp. ATCC 53533]RSM69624.1 gfo/Idh/MocA family oxidoreductase [Actinoplanes sp. ATCC 53533]